MSRFRVAVLLLFASFASIFLCDVAQAQKGRGKSPNKHNKSNHGIAGQRTDLKPKAMDRSKEKWVQHGSERIGGPKEKVDAPAQPDNPAVDKQSLVEQRKLEHRRQVAEHLRQVAERNGNENLLDTADRQDEKAQQHYEKRMIKINAIPSSEEPEVPAPEPEAPSPSDTTPTEGASIR